MFPNLRLKKIYYSLKVRICLQYAKIIPEWAQVLWLLTAIGIQRGEGPNGKIYLGIQRENIKLEKESNDLKLDNYNLISAKGTALHSSSLAYPTD